MFYFWLRLVFNLLCTPYFINQRVNKSMWTSALLSATSNYVSNFCIVTSDHPSIYVEVEHHKYKVYPNRLPQSPILSVTLSRTQQEKNARRINYHVSVEERFSIKEK